MELTRVSTEISARSWQRLVIFKMEFRHDLSGVCMIRIELGYRWFKDLGWRLARGWLVKCQP